MTAHKLDECAFCSAGVPFSKKTPNPLVSLVAKMKEMGIKPCDCGHPYQGPHFVVILDGTAGHDLATREVTLQPHKLPDHLEYDATTRGYAVSAEV